LHIVKKVPLSLHTTMGVGGDALYYSEAEGVDDLRELMLFAREKDVPVFILGGGSNVVFSDRGFLGLVIHVAIKGVRIEAGSDGITFVAGAGEDWDSFVEKTVAEGVSGVECLSGIPGSVGATPIQNVGAYGQEVSQTIRWVEVLDRKTGELRTLTGAECGFAYRASRFKGPDRRRFVVLSVAFRLRPAVGDEGLRYADLRRYFSERNIAHPEPAQVREAVLAIRATKGMVVDDGDPDSRSCGSFFLNPFVPRARLREMEDRGHAAGALEDGESIPCHEAGEGVKVSAAWLIERAGFRRGMRVGNVGLSGKHVLAIVNCGGATAAETIDLMSTIMSRVRSVFGVTLEPEPVLAMF
jgi:UDP-N-acetylmuramate dehydrogenase